MCRYNPNVEGYIWLTARQRGGGSSVRLEDARGVYRPLLPPRLNKEVFDAEVFAIYRALRALELNGLRGFRGRHRESEIRLHWPWPDSQTGRSLRRERGSARSDNVGSNLQGCVSWLLGCVFARQRIQTFHLYSYAANALQVEQMNHHPGGKQSML